ncbi:MAG: ABC transporter ATP-binding protein [Desulfatibacillum sp.]|nr:ABC transporter ATP-binding protein [Desulfatibacillum sp.]
MAQAALKLDNVKKSFGDSQIINGVDLEVVKGERHAIIGPNGAGKSTLFHLISGLYEVTGGTIALNGSNITNMAPHKINRLGLARSFQITNIFPNMTVFQNVRCALLWNKGYKYSIWHLCDRLKKVNLRTEEILEKINLAPLAKEKAAVLTYADQRALEIGITIACGADIIMLDEPTAGMSNKETAKAVELIKSVTEGKTLLIVEHDMGVVFDLADRISVLVYGKILATGTPDAVRCDPKVQEAYLGKETVECSV